MPAQGKKRARGGGERVSKAPKMRRSCDACACAKRKCDGEMRCSLCTKKGISCIYSERQRSGPKGNHIPGTAKQAATVGAAGTAGAPTNKGGKAAQKRPAPAATGGPKPKKKIYAGAASAAPAAPATGTATAAAAAAAASKTTTVGRQQQQTTHQSPLSPLTPPKSKTPRPRPPVVAPITAASPKSSPASSSSPAGSSLIDKPTTSTSPVPVPAAARPRQQPRPVAKKEPHPRHQLKSQYGGGKGKDPAAAAAAPVVVTPVGYPSAAVTGKDGRGARMPVAPPLPPRLSLSSSKAAVAATPPLSSLLLRDEVLPAAVSSVSGSSIDEASSSLSWDDVPDVFVSSLEDNVLWSCDDFSDDGTGGEGGVGVGAEGGDEKHFPAGRLSSGPSRGEKMRTVERAVSPTVEMILLDDPPASTTSRLAGGFGNHHQLRHRESSPMLQKRASSPVEVSPRQQAALVKGNGRHQQSIEVDEPIVVGALPAVGRRSSTSSASSASSASTDIGRRQTSYRRFPGDVTGSPISSWTQDAVEAGASTLLAVLADTDFCGAAVGCGSDGVTGDGRGHGGLQKQQLQQQQHRFQHNQFRQNQHLQHQRQHQHHAHPANTNSSSATIRNHNARLSLRWPPQAAPVGHGRMAHVMGSRISPPTTTPSTAAAFDAVGSRPWHHQMPTPGAPTQQRHGSHHQQRSQPPCGPGEGMSTASKEPWAARGERSGFKMYQTASL